jgi:hypothetical protein
MYGYIKTKTFMKIVFSLGGGGRDPIPISEPALAIILLSNFVLFIT